ncbi:hypothetical protein [Zavarzinella formosa]|uniref:hypothetical protein n=1 Tax=Zavarzinella formosa TaxID=360055 RepID=UPI0002F09D89|nr:hypothetical protein [Zavarzinella formosa]
MGFFADFAQGFVRGAMAGAIAQNLGQPPGRISGGAEIIERLCRQVGWDTDGRGRNVVSLHFNDPLMGTRQLRIQAGEEGRVAILSVASAATLSARRVPDDLPACLLARNASLLAGAWQASVSETGEVAFVLKYCALLDGLDSGAFKYLCETLLCEANALDTRMAAAGLL